MTGGSVVLVTGATGRRGGAVSVFRDRADPERHLEVREVGSSAERLRQHERVSVADVGLEGRARALQNGDGPPKVARLLAGAQTETAKGADEGEGGGR